MKATHLSILPKATLVVSLLTLFNVQLLVAHGGDVQGASPVRMTTQSSTSCVLSRIPLYVNQNIVPFCSRDDIVVLIFDFRPPDQSVVYKFLTDFQRAVNSRIPIDFDGGKCQVDDTC